MLCLFVICPYFQGLFNVLVYRFAFYLRLKARNPHLTKWELFRSTWRWSYLGPPPDIRHRRPAASILMARRSSVDQLKEMRAAMSSSVRYSNNCRNGEGKITSANSGQSEDSVIADATFNVSKVTDDELFGMHDQMEEMMGDLMVDYSDNPSLLNQNMSTVQTAFPVVMLDDNPPSNTDFPISISRFSDNPTILPMSDYPVVNND